MSDHFPVFCVTGSQKNTPKPTEPLIFKYRPMSDTCLRNISNKLNEMDWNYLQNLETTQAFTDFTNKLNDIINIYAPEKNVTIQPRFIIREKWMTKGLMKSSHTLNKLYRKC